MLKGVILLCLCLLVYSACPLPNYSQVPFGSETYCIKCDTSCATCSETQINNCLTCATDFTFQSTTSMCLTPNSGQKTTLESSYKFYGFVASTGWSGGSVTYCNQITIYRADPGPLVRTSITLTSHYKMRLLVSLWWLSTSPVLINIKITNVSNSINLLNRDVLPPSSEPLNRTTSGAYQAYCDDSRALNYDSDTLDTVLDSFSNQVTVTLTSSTTTWGIREFVLIQYQCYAATCKACNGPAWNQCIACQDDKRVVNNVVGGQCLCDASRHYYRHPDSNYCVNLCPAKPQGQYYGNPFTSFCETSCPVTSSISAPWRMLFADDVSGQCAETCPVSISLGNIPKPLFYDVTNRRCVTNCPSTAPYSWSINRTCVATCPTYLGISYYANPRTLNCQTSCLDASVTPLFKHSNQCVEDCQLYFLWSDFLLGSCASTCSTDGVDIYFKDNSTLKSLCVKVCPGPDFYGDPYTAPSDPWCQVSCPSPYFGDNYATSLRKCVPLCSGSYFGVLSGNRPCLARCPEGTWGERATYTCITTPSSCDGTRYADNDRWLCVDRGTCSLGRFSHTATRTCVQKCPTGTYADSNTMHCQVSCTLSTEFADPGINKCVTVCQTQDLYADVDSGNKCVATCSPTGLYQFRDNSTRKCVDTCPDSPYYYADPTAKRCVFNCTPGLYADDSVANKSCLTNCINNYFGDNSTGYGRCVSVCPIQPPLFGDVVSSIRVCIAVCSPSSFGDQTGLRRCGPTCPNNWFAQDDTARRCVSRCKSNTYGHTDWICHPASGCPSLYTGDPSTNRCVDRCPESEGTFSDFISKLCLTQCPIDSSSGTPALYFADPTNRWCVRRCSSTANLFGNNDTRTCQDVCVNNNSFADSVHQYRYCISWCTHQISSGQIIQRYYRNNYTSTCVVPANCQNEYFADNNTQACVGECPIVGGLQTWGHFPTRTCVSQCYNSQWGDTSTGVAICVSTCPLRPAKWSYDGNMTCMAVCPTSPSLFGDDFTRSCVSNCPRPPAQAYQTYAYTGTRRCVAKCPNTFFSDYIQGVCWPTPQQCTYGWGDPYNNSCTRLCTGPIPWDSYGDNGTALCKTRCSPNSYADSFTGIRVCVAICPGSYDSVGTSTGTYDTYGDTITQRCLTRCETPGTWADWQTHLCSSRCTGDNPAKVPTYSQNGGQRCVIALACPVTPDKLFGDNRTRSCLTTCYHSADWSVIEWADNLTRTCLPQCLNTTNTRFYGDYTSGAPRCIITCPQVPRLFGEKVTNKCVPECPAGQYGQQTRNRSCEVNCPVISNVLWYSQITERLCVLRCQDGTYANDQNQHCETVGTDCIASEFGDGSTNKCVPLCPESMNFFGDPSTKLCTPRCPTLLLPVVNVTANINLPAGYLYADYSTRLCVARCPHTDALHGTFGDNTTNTCVYRCPDGSYGDPNTANRHCVASCSANSYADDLTNRCVSQCPASPPSFGNSANWKCVLNCPDGTWNDASTRKCVADCPANQFRENSLLGECVNVCPSDPDLYGDSITNNCVATCTGGRYADPTTRTCKTSCLPLFQYAFRCVQYCPDGLFANLLKDCVAPTSCDPNTYGDNATTQCTGTCLAGSFADPNSRYCIAVCPDGWYGDGNVCVQTCQTLNTALSTISQVCMSRCVNFTYSQNGVCRAQCVVGYANDQLGACLAYCPAQRYTDPTTHRCVAICPTNYFRDSNSGSCKAKVGGCNPLFADYITGNCVTKCSPGTWGETATYTCEDRCPDNSFGYATATQRTCYTTATLSLSAPKLFGDVLSNTFVTVCPHAPIVYFGDRILKMCVSRCQDHSSTKYYGDSSSRECQTTCLIPTFYTADSSTRTCNLRCSLGLYRLDSSAECVAICPTGYADPSTRVCVATCPADAGTFGYIDASSTERTCVEVCPGNFFSEPIQRTCTAHCPANLYAQASTNQCVPYCLNSFADDSNNVCVASCLSSTYPNADNSTNKCVLTCPTVPDYYSDSRVCVLFCSNPTHFADPSTRNCVPRCPSFLNANNVPYFSYGDPRTKRCVLTCSLGYWGDNSTGLCTTTCSPSSFAENSTRICQAACSVSNKLYADPLRKMCATTCSVGSFGSQDSQTCVPVCDLTYWGDTTSTMCVSICPMKTLFFGENTTRTCASSCLNRLGFADNHTRMCVDVCQNTSAITTFADSTTKTCVPICPQGYWAENRTNECRQNCLHGYADDYSQFCVARCPSDPDTYGDNVLFKCIKTCLRGQFSDNSTNLCVPVCPASPAYFGDPTNGRCVLFCSEGLYAQNDSRLCIPVCPPSQYADNLTRKCVQYCPMVQQATYADETTHRCVRTCPTGYWADNSTKSCVATCPVLTNGSRTFSDDNTRFCVVKCTHPYFGRNDTKRCVPTCSAALDEYGHLIGRICVIGTDCYKQAGLTFYSDPTTRTCVQKCPIGLWAHPISFRCVGDCGAPTYYRDSHNQRCVPLCPTNPDQYADSSTGNCVTRCPTSTYAYFTAVVRQCIGWCGTYNLYDDNSTNRCQADCPTEPFMFRDPLVKKCVHHCSGGRFADNTTQNCVSTCPAAVAYFGDLHTFQCVLLCQDGEFADVAQGRTCRPTCTAGSFADRYSSSCISHCQSVRPHYYEDLSTGSGVCVHACPGESYGYQLTQVCMTQNADFSSSCPGLYYADRTSRECVKFCPFGTYANPNTKYCETTCFGNLYADPVSRMCLTTCPAELFALAVSSLDQRCVQFCPDNTFAQNSTKTCTTRCSVLLGLETTRSCEARCPEPYYADWSRNLCVTGCNPNFADDSIRTCVNPCTAPDYANPLTFTCDLICPDNYFGINGTRTCSQTCPGGSFADPTIRTCVSTCSRHPQLFADSRSNECLPACSPSLFANQITLTCDSSCTTIASGQIYLADSDLRKCVLECVSNPLTYADYQNHVCTSLCPEGKFASNYTKECLSTCPEIPVPTYAENNSNICRDICPPWTYGEARILTCVSNCWWPNFADSSTNLCVDKCPLGTFAQNETASCRTQCLEHFYAQPNTRRCLPDCPEFYGLFKYTQTRQCTRTCPQNYFANDHLRQCVRICDSTIGLFAYTLSGECVRECPPPYRGYDVTHMCILNCPVGFFYNVSYNLCSRCPPECVSCFNLDSCLSCQAGYNLFSGVCGRSCIPTNGLITFADPAGTCVQLCPPTYFGNTFEYVCTKNCPAKQYGQATSRLCMNCPSTCALCISPTKCLTCVPSASIAIDNMCYANCNSTHRFTFQGSCYATCPDGTFITFTQASCDSCASTCLTCIDSATKCTSCSGRFLIDETCVTQCPNGYYGTTDSRCLICTDAVPSCSKPLTFNTTVGIENFQYVISVAFNKEVDIQKQIQDLLKVRLQMQRRLLQSSLVNQGIKYTYKIQNGVIKLYLQIDTNLSNPVFVVEISDPSAIKTIGGMESLQNAQSSLDIKQVEFYPASDGAQATINTASKFAVVSILVFYAITFLWTDTLIRPIQFMQVLLLHALVNVSVPAGLYFYIMQLKPAIFQFLPNWFISRFEDKNIYSYCPQKVVDMFYDYSYLRNVGQAVFWIALFLPIWLTFMTLSNRRIISNRIWNSLFENIFFRRFGLNSINEILSLFYVPILWFSLFQLNDLKATGTGFMGFNAFMSVTGTLLALIIPLVWFRAWSKLTQTELEIRYPFLTRRLKEPEEEDPYAIEDTKLQIGEQKQPVQINHTPTKCVHNLEPLIHDIWLILVCVTMVALYHKPTAQMSLLFILNIGYFGYIIWKQPHLSTVNTVFHASWCLFLCIIELLIVYFDSNGGSVLNATEKTAICSPFLIFMSVFLLVSVMWAGWRCIWDGMSIWNFFKQTDFYLVFGDPEHEVASEKSEPFERFQPLVENLVINEGDILIDQIKKEVNRDGQNIIKVRKKILKKKPKPIKRGQQPELQGDFVRINKVNPFDYVPEQLPILQPTSKKLSLDDDNQDSDEELGVYRVVKGKSSKGQNVQISTRVKLEEGQKPLISLSEVDEKESRQDSQVARQQDNTSNADVSKLDYPNQQSLLEMNEPKKIQKEQQIYQPSENYEPIQGSECSQPVESGENVQPQKLDSELIRQQPIHQTKQIVLEAQSNNLDDEYYRDQFEQQSEAAERQSPRMPISVPQVQPQPHAEKVQQTANPLASEQVELMAPLNSANEEPTKKKNLMFLFQDIEDDQ